MELKTVRTERRDHLATVWLHRPHRHNAWTGRMLTELRWVMAELEADRSVRAVVITGTPPAFCVGGDSDALAGHAARGAYDPGTPDDLAAPGASMRPEYDDDFAWLYAFRTPVIAAVNGSAAGIGLALALFCDLRYGAAAAKITTAAPKLGLPAEYGMSWVLPRLVGVTRAAELLLTGRTLTIEETADWGLWNGIEANGQAALDAAWATAETLATTAGPDAVTTTKQQLYADLHRHDVAASIGDSKRLLNQAMATAEYREGVAALRDRRPPRFSDGSASEPD